MKLERLHRTLAVLMALSALIALAGGAGTISPSVPGAAAGLLLALIWQPRTQVGALLDRLWLIAALLLVVRAILTILGGAGIGVAPWIDLLLILLVAEALRPLPALNDARLYGLSFALMIASTAYRPGLVFALAFAGYVVFGTVAMMVGFMRRQAEQHGVARLTLRRPVLYLTAALSIVTLLTAGSVFLLFPRVAGGWMARDTGTGASVAGFGSDVSLAEHGSEIQTNDEVALRIEFTGRVPDDLAALHWRGKSFDHFDGTQWAASPGLPRTGVAPDAYALRWRGRTIDYEVFSASMKERVLFGLHPLLDVRPRTEFYPYMTRSGDAAYRGDGAPIYLARSKAAQPPATELRRANVGVTPGARYYLQLPDLPQRIHALADSLTRDMPTRYDKTLAVERWLREDFAYTRELPPTALDASLDAFLFERRAGHCEYFSSAMVVLLRAAGIPARNVTGFLGGEWNEFGQYLLVRQDRAHSWVEVWFPSYGWVQFDPTPAEASEPFGNERMFAAAGLFLDGLQHRWEKWVLDYNLQRQMDIVEQVSDFFSTNRETPSGAVDRDFSWQRLFAGLMLAGLVALAIALLRGIAAGKGALTEASRMYLALRRAYARAGLAEEDGDAPLGFLAQLRAAGAPGTEPAGRLVDHYLKTRFGERPMTDTARAQMRDALEEVRAALARPARRAPR